MKKEPFGVNANRDRFTLNIGRYAVTGVRPPAAFSSVSDTEFIPH